MKSKKTLILIIFTLFGAKINAQTIDFYYTFNNEKIFITKVPGKNFVEFSNELQVNNQLQGKKISKKSYVVSDNQDLSLYSPVVYTSPTYVTSSGLELNYKNEIVLKFKSNTNQISKLNLVTSLNLVLLKSTPSYELYKVNGDALQVSKNVYMSGQVEFCTPNFITKLEKTDYIPNDQYFNQQWYLHNTGQGTNDGHTTTIDADIDAPEAWDITKGSPNVIIAIIDEGVTSDHPDLPNTRQLRLPGSNFAYEYDLTNNPNDPNNDFEHMKGHNNGNACAGIVAATHDNNEGISGIAPLCRIMPVKIPLGYSAPSNLFADAINFANENGADIISNSWSSPIFIPVIVSAINNAINNNRLVVFSAGNNANRIVGNNGSVTFPGNASIPDLITVGASDRNNNQANYSPNGINLNIVAPSSTATNYYIPGEGNNIWTIDTPGLGTNGYNPINGYIDDMFPAHGEIMPSNGTNFGSYTGRFGGTSAAAPQIAGVLALMRSVNNCLPASQLKIILQDTADKIGGFNYNWNSSLSGHSIQLGYGKVNAFKAVQKAQSMSSPTLDLMIKDGVDDLGIQPNTITQEIWSSTDIWIRNNDDNGLVHQNPEYHPTTPNYAHVRITNKSCVPSIGNEVLTFHWAKAGTALDWPNSWNGQHNFAQGPVRGLPLGTYPIPIIQPGQEIIIKIPFLVPNPANYNWFQGWEQWHFCFLARIESTIDPLTETNQLVGNVINNNNIGWKNVTVVDLLANRTSGTVAVSNPFNETRTFFLELIKEDLETGKAIYDEAEVSIKMDDVLFNEWERGGEEALQIDPTIEEKRKIVKGNNVIIDNISFNANEVGSLTLDFNFLTKELTGKSEYVYHVVQKDANTGEIIGGETYVIKKDSRNPFEAIAGDKEVNLNEPITISASDISEPAIYNWYDEQGNLIHQGKDLQIASAIAEKYKLEVISTIDGFKDYKDVEVTLKPSVITNISPNPASNIVQVSYKLNEVGSAYIMVINNYGGNGISNNYILDTNNSEININISNYVNGFYTFALVVNGQIVDAKNLIKQ